MSVCDDAALWMSVMQESRGHTVVAHAVRSGITALNVVTGALDTDETTRALLVLFGRNLKHTIEHIHAATKNGGRALVAWSFYSPDFFEAADELRAIRDQTSGLDVLHVAGGVHATAEPLATLQAGFDLVAMGEGESTFVSLTRDWLDGKTLQRIEGTGVLENGRLIRNGHAQRRELDAFPSFNIRYVRFNALEITRGCVYACSFCQTPFMFKARFRHRSVKSVREHARVMRQYDSRYVRFLTPTSLSYGSDGVDPNPDAVDELLGAVREEMGPDAQIYFGTFPSECRPEHVTPRAMAILKKWVNNETIIIGGQSGSERVLRDMHRGHGVEVIEQAVRYAVEAGFRPDVDLLVGMPGETGAEREETVLLAKKLVAMGARIHSHAFMPLPGTPLKDSRPEALEPSVKHALQELESQGASYGLWRVQERIARDLVKIRPARS